jgi:hypothetical protein
MSIAVVTTTINHAENISLPQAEGVQKSSPNKKNCRCSCLSSTVSNIATFVLSLIPGYSFYQIKKAKVRLIESETKADILQQRVETLNQTAASLDGDLKKVHLQLAQRIAEVKSAQKTLEQYARSDKAQTNTIENQEKMIVSLKNELHTLTAKLEKQKIELNDTYSAAFELQDEYLKLSDSNPTKEATLLDNSKHKRT